MDDERDSWTGKLRSIVHRGAAIRSELALLVLIIGTLAATCNLLLAIHRHAETTPQPADNPSTTASIVENRPSSPVKPVSPNPAIVQQPPQPVEVLPPPEDPTPLAAMDHRLKTSEGKKLYALRKQTPEPVFGIIKSVLGFRQFLLRGLDNVRGEWNLVTMAWNMKRMFVLAGAN